MAYRFENDERSGDALRRIANEELDEAIAQLSPSAETLDARVHEARKHLKKLRAVLALAEGSAAPGELARAGRAVRKAAHALADLRGRAALRESLDALQSADPGSFDDAFFARACALLTLDPNPTGAPTELGEAEECLHAAKRRLEGVRFRGSGWPNLAPGFERTYRRARRALVRAKEHPESEVLHRFRTPAKRHLYHVQLLEPLWPELLHAHRKELSRLGDLLGDHHDLSLLGPELEQRGLSGDDLVRLQRSIVHRSRALEGEIFELGGRLFAERPRAVGRRFGSYFEGSSNA